MTTRHLKRAARWLVVAAAVAACSPAASSPAPTPTTEPGSTPTSAATPSQGPTPVSTATAFTSPLYGYSIVVPAGWTIIPGTSRWDGAGAPGSDTETVDQLIAPSVESRCKTVFTCGPNAWALSIPTTQALDAFAAARDAADAADHPCPTAPETKASTTLAGLPAVLESKHCPPGAGGQFVTMAVVVKSGVGYVFYLEDRSHDQTAEPADVADFAALLKTIQLPG
jgi:hypothetical protein